MKSYLAIGLALVSLSALSPASVALAQDASAVTDDYAETFGYMALSRQSPKRTQAAEK
ncbi:hypothetical protein [Roseibium aggregatum]|jgi:hypothetical protein|uniref:hypothetical protein n=1 Tax=Roseibium aggregatum TaxID=187304 RepID=UPI001E2A3574|nr:hypothetical protein [Roseibium aggregatum]